jgi:hypothetical protein
MVAGRNNPTRQHINPHHAWAYLHFDPVSDLSTAEHDHIVGCEQCLRLFILCLKSDTFGAVLKALAADTHERKSA